MGSLRDLEAALERLRTAFSDLPGIDEAFPLAPAGNNSRRVQEVLLEVADRLRDNYPYFHPLYAGQMLKPPHPIARLAYELALHINPNNHALDGGRASSAMEKEAVAELATMIGWETHLGHLCGGGTMANLEALWIAGQLHPGKTVLASTQAHYTHQRIAGVLGLPFETVPCDRRGRMDTPALERRLAAGGVGTVVATMGTTATGAVDPLADIVALRRHHEFRIHADAAYGGYFLLAANLEAETTRAFEQIKETASAVIDPHKHGLQPYGCGCVLFRDPSVGRLYRHDSPYTYYTSTEMHLGEIALECSRPGAAAVALWATQRLLPLVRSGEFATGLAAGREAALKLYQRLRGDGRFATGAGGAPELDILVWAPRAASVTEASSLSKRIFAEAASRQLHLALVSLPLHLLDVGQMQRDRDTIICLRSVLMKPEHRDWADRIWAILDEATNAAGVERR